ncbi:hypothetical protein H257_08937 [Aphanomyces astaci]|uniref:Uncharacterized protein n=1 Tax=Aphanomyces astaci TaxID=112090 RepID=W4GCL1_APHAT|nr:hypothetical protein H257_08937 [Aphanomyces astaci]ETV77021.1 hypothetical protein H257_08937 [Aphanomyces astaci]|eukprot:XP_009833327.1 hypothetical protein H257_08937 [Aphanomyces astaci]
MSGFMQLFAAESADAAATAQCLMTWFTTFGDIWVSDGGPQIKNEVIENVGSPVAESHTKHRRWKMEWITLRKGADAVVATTRRGHVPLWKKHDLNSSSNSSSRKVSNYDMAAPRRRQNQPCVLYKANSLGGFVLLRTHTTTPVVVDRMG